MNGILFEKRCKLCQKLKHLPDFVPLIYLLECAESQSQQGKCYFEPKMPQGDQQVLGRPSKGVLWAGFLPFLKKGTDQKFLKKGKEVRCEKETSWICITQFIRTNTFFIILVLKVILKWYGGNIVLLIRVNANRDTAIPVNNRKLRTFTNSLLC